MTHPIKPTVPATFIDWWFPYRRGIPFLTSLGDPQLEVAQDAWTAATAAQSEKLRIAVEALEEARAWFYHTRRPTPSEVDFIDKALSKLRRTSEGE